VKFVGYVPMRRGILDHLMDRRLSLQEYAALTALILLADKSTGIGKINASVLRVYVPELGENAAKRVLKSLEDKRYILRKITPRSPIIYPYAVDKYTPTVGPHKMLQLSITKARDSRRFGDIEYLKPDPDGRPESDLEGRPEGRPDGDLEGRPEGEHYNDKRERQEVIVNTRDKENTCPTVIEECASTCDTIGASSAIASSTAVRHAGEAGAPQCALSAPQLPDEEFLFGFDLKRIDGVVCSVHTGEPVPPGALASLLGETEGKLQ
jgi:hypothetical protein